jgi:signal transduction histidine kinase
MQIPIRLKILASALLLLMLAMAIVTGVMANLFHADKKIYIMDLTAVTASGAQSEVDTLLRAYASSLQAFGDLMDAPYLTTEQRQRASQSLFEANPEMVAVTARAAGASPVTSFDRRALAELKLTEKDITVDLPAAAAGPAGPQERAIAELGLPAASQGRTIRITMRTPHAVVGEFRVGKLMDALTRVRSFGIVLVDRNRAALMRNAAARDLPELNIAAPAAGGSAIVSEQQIGGDNYLVAGTASSVAPVGLLVTAPRSATYLTARTLLWQLVLVGIVLVGVVAMLAMVVARRLSRPVEHLSRAVDAVGAGNFDVSVSVTSRDEVAQLARSFNTMAVNLRERDARLREAHEQLVHSEKMAALGQLSAGLAHEVKNPLAGILGYAQLTRRSLDSPEVITRNLDVIERETRRCTEIINQLMRFSRQEPAKRAACNVNEAVVRAIGLVEHQLGLASVQVRRELADALPPVVCDANQLQQVVVNLLINAQQAMEHGGTVRVSTRSDADAVSIEVDDSGPGVPEEIRKRIFEPFFTTKPAGRGTGLGLSVSYGIIRDHGGDIRVGAAPGGGARFTIALPVGDRDQAKQFRRPEQGVAA